MRKSNTAEKLMESLERNGLTKSSQTFKRKTQPSLYLTFLMETRSFPKVTHVVSISAIKPTEKIFWEEMPTNKSPYTLLWVS